MKKYILFLGITLPIFLGSCRGFNAENSNGEDSLAVDSIITYDIDSVVIKNTTDTCIDVECSIEYLKGKGMPLDSINATITETITGAQRTTRIKDALDYLTDSLWNDCLSSKQEDVGYRDDPIPAANYTYEMTGKFINKISKGSRVKDTGIISYQFNCYTYLGGAHGGSSYIFLNFNTKNGHLMTPWDILDKKHEQEIIALMLKHLLKENNCKTKDELIDKTSILSLGDLYVTRNFLVTEKGLMFHFGQYELACYAAGMQDIDLTWDELESAGLLLSTRS